jgi:uncharacterized integral membrane protein (TIGR00698 family)
MLTEVRRFLPGLGLAAAVALIAKFLDQGGFGSALLFALLIGMLARPLSEMPIAAPGVDFSANHLLAIAVALLGVRLSLADVAAIGILPAVIVAAAVAATIAFSVFAARTLGLSTNFALIAGSGVAFCGASAAVAVAAVLPKKAKVERDTALVIAGVIGLSAIAMVLYPVFATFVGFNEVEAGLFLGGSIHNVPQAVAAGMAVSEAAGSMATLTKLFRISLLAPFVVGLAVVYGKSASSSTGWLNIPWFVIAFAALLVAGSLGFIPEEMKVALLVLSTWLMLLAVASIGMKTSLEAMQNVGAGVLMLLVMNTLVLAAILFLAVQFIPLW